MRPSPASLFELLRSVSLVTRLWLKDLAFVGRCRGLRRPGSNAKVKSAAVAASMNGKYLGWPWFGHGHGLATARPWPWLGHGSTAWLSHGSATAQPWHDHGSAMARPWLDHGSTMARPWFDHGSAMAQPWLGYGSAMAWPWLGHGSAMAWPWLGHGLAKALKAHSLPFHFCLSHGHGSDSCFP